MSWRTVVVNSRCKLDYNMGYMVMRSSEVKKVFLDEIAIVILESTAISLTTHLLKELATKKIKVIFCDEYHNPIAENVPLYANYNANKNMNSQINWKEETKSAVWAKIIQEKIRQQAIVLREFGEKAKADMLMKYYSEVVAGDETNREGHSAKVYFNALFDNDFSRGQDIATNAMLNYGYALLLSAFNREIVSCGYLTGLGIGHHNVHNAFNLSCDFMEPFRPIVDRIVKKISPAKFEQEEKHKIISLFNEIFIIDGKTQILPNVISIYTRGLLSTMDYDDLKQIVFFERKAG